MHMRSHVYLYNPANAGHRLKYHVGP